MGKRWWQKEARAKAEQEKKDRKNAVVDTEITEVVEPVYEKLDQATTGTVLVIEDAIDDLEQAVSELVADDSALTEVESTLEQDDDPVVVPGITLSVNSTNASNNKKKRRR